MSKKKSRKIRPDSSYVDAAKRLAPFAPSLSKYKRRKRLNRWEKAAIARKEKLLRNIDNLVPLTKKQAQILGRDKLWQPKEGAGLQGIRAIRLSNVNFERGVQQVRITKKDGLQIISGNRLWTYVPTSADIQDLADSAAALFKKYNNKILIALWTVKGRSAASYGDLPRFLQFLIERYNTYADPDDWVLGLAWVRKDFGAPSKKPFRKRRSA